MAIKFTKASTQLVLAGVEAANDVNGIEMGVLTGGTAYLTTRGLARVCGVAPSTIINQRDEWAAGKRVNKFATMLVAQGYAETQLYVPVNHLGQPAHAYREDVCMAFLEYFAFDSPSPSKVAETSYRQLARAGLRVFVYTALGYTRPATAPPAWQKFHDRMLLVTAPVGYFSVFKEIADFVLAAIRGGLPVDEHTIPDISVGKTWGTQWTERNLAATYGERIKHEHNYPDGYPQAASNPQEIWVYPVHALGEFRIWLQHVYVPQKYPKYLDGKVAKGALGASAAQMLSHLAAAPVPAQIAGSEVTSENRGSREN